MAYSKRIGCLAAAALPMTCAKLRTCSRPVVSEGGRFVAERSVCGIREHRGHRTRAVCRAQQDRERVRLRMWP